MNSITKFDIYDEVKISDCAPEKLRSYKNTSFVVEGMYKTFDATEPKYWIATPDESLRLVGVEESWLVRVGD